MFSILNQLCNYRTAGRLSENIYTFTAEASDNKARFRCEASNIMSQTPLKAEVDLTVLCKLFMSVSFGSFHSVKLMFLRNLVQTEILYYDKYH